MKKIFLILSILFLLSGCSVNYEINITKDYINDNIDIFSLNEEDSNSILNYKEPLPADINSILPENPEEKYDDVEYYNETKSLDNNGYYHLNYQYTFKKDEYVNNNVINLAAGNFYYTMEDNEISISASYFAKLFNAYANLNTVNTRVNVSSDYEIIGNSANERVDNTLTWQITRDNYKTNSIFLRIKDINSDKPIVNDNDNQEENNNDENVSNKESIILALGALLIFIVIVVLIITIKNKLQKTQ